MWGGKGGARAAEAHWRDQEKKKRLWLGCGARLNKRECGREGVRLAREGKMVPARLRD